jgi:hypothetical protein
MNQARFFAAHLCALHELAVLGGHDTGLKDID